MSYLDIWNQYSPNLCHHIELGPWFQLICYLDRSTLMYCQAIILVIKMTAQRLWEYRGMTPNSSVFLSRFIGQVVQSKTSQSTIPGRYGRGSQPFVTKMLQHGWLTIRLKISVRVSKSVCLTVLLRLSTGVAIHQRSPTHGLDWPALEINGSNGHRRWSRLANISNQ